MSDHLDEGFRSPEGDSRVDVTDVYLFHPLVGSTRDESRVVLSMGVNPLLRRRAFRPDARYELLIDTDGDAGEDIVFRATFGAPDLRGAQSFVLERFASPGRAPVQIAEGQTNEIIDAGNGVKVFAGIRDDPFFIDLEAFLEGASTKSLNSIDSLAGQDITAIIIEVPSSTFSTTSIGVWGRVLINTTFGGFQQVDRAAHPEMNALFIPPLQRRNFNRTQPRSDRLLFSGSVRDSLIHSGGYDTAAANAIARDLLPDLLRLNLTEASDYPNGRNLEDDVVDFVLKLARNDPTATDGVDGNDVPFLTSFPYYAPGHGG